MKRAIDSFRGEVPRVTPRALPDNAATEAVNCRLLTGDLTAWRQFANTKSLANTGPVQSIFLLNDKWLSSDSDLDYARGAIAGDTTYRTYITGMDVPRFTNYALATTGSEPYPVVTRPLGVPGPDAVPTIVLGIDSTPTTYSIDTLDDNASLATSWVLGPQQEGATKFRVYQDVGAYRVEFDENRNPGQEAYAYRSFGISGVTVLDVSVDFYLAGDYSRFAQASIIVAASSLGAGIGVTYSNGVLSIWKTFGWGAIYFRSAVASVGAGVSPLTLHSLRAQATTNSDGTKTVVASVYTGSGLIATVTGTSIFDDGDFCAFSNGVNDDLTPNGVTYYYNFHVRASGSAGYVPVNVATSYVFTYVNDFAEESAPSLPSAVVVRPDGVSATVTTPTVIPSGISADYGITTKRIYRAATGNAGTAYRFVAEIPLGTASYVDTLTDAELGEVLQSESWDLPPSDLRGILALPNGVMAGFSKNQLCFSEQNHPHAWSVANRLNTDTKIVGIGNVDTTVVIGTESFVYVASGNDPAAYSMNKFEVPYAASSKNSFAYLTGIGVVFAGPNGLMAVQGIGQVVNLTETVFTRRQWQALNPPSMQAVSHNNIYWLFWESGSNRGCYALDMKATGFGVVRMAFHASAGYVDPIEDKMYLVLSENNEPDDPSLPVHPSAQPTVNGHTIAQFEGNPSVYMTYRFKGKLHLLEHPTWMSMAQVRGDGDYSNLLARVYGDGVQIDEVPVLSETEYTLPDSDEYTELQLEFVGTSTVRSAQVVEDVTELS